MRCKGIIDPRVERRVQPQKEWGWEIAVYLFLAGMGAGAYIVGTFFDWAWNLNIRIEISDVALDLAKGVLYWGPMLVAVGAPFLILDLGIRGRFLYACLNPRTSWVARGFLILSAFILLGLIVFGISLLSPRTDFRESFPWALLKGVTVLLAVSTALYTGILLKAVRYVPMWNTFLLPVLFLASALSTGAMANVLVMMAGGLMFPQAQELVLRAHEVATWERILILMEAVILTLYMYSVHEKKGLGKESVQLLLTGRFRELFWGGIVFLGFLFPGVLEIVSTRWPDQPIFLLGSGVSLLIGGFFLRWAVLVSGIKEKHPLCQFVEDRAKWGRLKSNPLGDRTA